MKTYSECKTEIARQYDYLTWSELKEHENIQNLDEFYEEVAKIYAQQVGEDVRQRCYDNADVTWEYDGYEDQPVVNEKSILNTEIILP